MLYLAVTTKKPAAAPDYNLLWHQIHKLSNLNRQEYKKVGMAWQKAQMW